MDVASGSGAEDHEEVMMARRRARAARALSFIAMVEMWVTRSENMEGCLA